MELTGADLRQRRLEAGLGVRELARSLGTWPRAVTQMEEARYPRAGTIENYLRALERAKAERRQREVQAGYEARLAAVERARGLVEELARVLVDATSEPLRSDGREAG